MSCGVKVEIYTRRWRCRTAPRIGFGGKVKQMYAFSEMGLLPGVVRDTPEAKWPLLVNSQRSILNIWKGRVNSASL